MGRDYDRQQDIYAVPLPAVPRTLSQAPSLKQAPSLTQNTPHQRDPQHSLDQVIRHALQRQQRRRLLRPRRAPRPRLPLAATAPAPPPDARPRPGPHSRRLLLSHMIGTDSLIPRPLPACLHPRAAPAQQPVKHPAQARRPRVGSRLPRCAPSPAPAFLRVIAAVPSPPPPRQAPGAGVSLLAGRGYGGTGVCRGADPVMGNATVHGARGAGTRTACG